MLEHIFVPAETPIPPTSSSHPLLVLLHGYGSNETDLLGLSHHFDSRFHLLSLRAPLQLEEESYSWFSFELQSDGGIKFNEAEAKRSGETVLKTIEEASQKYGFTPGPVFAMGFSQGASLSLGSMLLAPQRFSGIVAMSGGGLRPSMIPAEKNEHYAHLRVMLTHGIFDKLLPIHHGRQSEKELRRLPLDLIYREYAMGHEVSPESLRDIAAWLHVSLNHALSTASPARS